MSKPIINVGVVGCGYIAVNGHIPSILRCKDVKLIAVCDMNEELSRNVAAKFKASKYYSDFTKMLQCEKLNIIDICTPINTHAPLAIQAMEAGCHVLTEKPMAINTAECHKMVEAAQKNHVKLSVNHQLLFVPTIQKIKSLINSGIIGNPIRVEIVQSTPPRDYPPIADPNHWYHKLPGGIHGDNLPHPIYLTRELLGHIEPIAIYTSRMSKLEHLPIDEVQIILKGEKGNGTIISSCNYPSLWLINIFGTKKCVYCDLNNSYMVLYEGRSMAGRGMPLTYGFQNISRSFQILNSTLSMTIKFLSGKHRGLPISIAKFIESVQQDKQPPVTADDGKEVVRIWEEVTKQIR